MPSVSSLRSAVLEPIAVESAAESAFGRVLILKGDRFYGEALREAVQRVYPAAVQVMSRLRDAKAFLAASRVDLLITGIGLADGEGLDLLTVAAFRDGRFGRVLVVTGRKEQDVLSRLRALPIDGVFDPTCEGAEQFERTLRTLATGRSWWSPGVLERLREPNGTVPAICRRAARLPSRRGLAVAAL